MSYTLTELIEKLQDVADEYPDLADQEVNVAYQRSYPLAGFISAVTIVETDDEDSDECECPSTKECEHCPEPAIWIGISDNSSEPYAPKAAWRE